VARTPGGFEHPAFRQTSPLAHGIFAQVGGWKRQALSGLPDSRSHGKPKVHGSPERRRGFTLKQRHRAGPGKEPGDIATACGQSRSSSVAVFASKMPVFGQ
jgi:hypothetical protein